jgi:acyl carrier protein
MTQLSTQPELDERIAALPEHRRAALERLLARQPAVHDVSDAQRGLWFIDRLAPASPLYVVAWRCELAGPLDPAAFRRSVQTLVRRHDALRTRFGLHDGRPVQIVDPEAAVTVHEEDLRPVPATERADEVARRATQEAGTGFDLGRSPLLRIRLLRVADERHVLLLSAHHIVFDGASTDLFLRELRAVYEAEATGTTVALPAVQQYPAFAAGQRERLAGPAGQRRTDFWRERLSPPPPVLDIPTGRPRPPVPTHAGRTIRFTVPMADVAPMGVLASQQRCSPFMAYLAVLQLLLARYSGHTDICLGTPAGNRTDPQSATVVGMCANIIALRTDLSGAPTFRELLDRVRVVCLDAYDHQEVPFEQVVEAVAPERSLAFNPIFQVACALAAEPADAGADGRLRVEDLDAVPSGLAKFDFSFAGALGPDGLRVTVEYRTELYEAGFVDRLTEHFAVLWRAAAAQPDQPVTTLPILSATELDRLAAAVPAVPLPSLAAVLGAHPGDRVAVEVGGRRVRYADVAGDPLYARLSTADAPITAAFLDAVAGLAREIGFGPDDRVAVLGHPTGTPFAAALAAGLGAGATCCVPDPDDPALAGLEPAAVGRFLREHAVTALWLPSRMLHRLLPGGPGAAPPEWLAGLRLLVTDRRIAVAGPRARVVALDPRTGPIGVGADETALTVPAGVGAYVLDNAGAVLPAGVIGDLHIGASRDAARPVGRLGRRSTDGTLAVLGDLAGPDARPGRRSIGWLLGQELGGHPNVRDAYVADTADGWHAYVVPRAGTELTLRDVQSFLASTLAPYAVPVAVVTVDALPLDDAGEVIPAALPGAAAPERDRPRVPPRTALERLLVSVWQELFGAGEIGVEDNFFDLGGHSLMAVRMLGMLTEFFGVDLSISVLFGTPTPAALADRLAELLGGPAEAEALARSIEDVLALPEDEVRRRLDTMES